MPKKRVDPMKKKQQRQKVFVIVGGILLLGAFAFEAKSLGLLGGKKAAAPPPVAAPAGTPTTPNSLTPPGLPGATGAPTPVSATPGESGLADTDPQLGAASGQLASFSVFETKNPFAPQVKTGQGGSTSPPSDDHAQPGDTGSGTGKTSGDTPPATAGDVPPPGASVTPAGGDAGDGTGNTGGTGTTPAGGGDGGTTGTSTTATDGATVTISVNGHPEKVGRDGTFPADSPVFRLVSFDKGKAEVGIVGGSYQSGDATLTLVKGKAVTLMNTSDDKRYKLVLLATP